MNKGLLYSELRRDEGERLVSYKDSLGYWTIGVGHLIDPSKGANPSPFGENLISGRIKLSEAQVDNLLANDVKEKITQLDQLIPWWVNLSDARQRVMVNMAFNMGTTTLMNFKKMMTYLKSGDYELAAKEMMNSKWASQVGARANRLSDMMVQG